MGNNYHTQGVAVGLFERVLRSHGASLTKQRRLVFDILHSQKPQSMAEILKVCKGDLDRASLYRIIDLFERLGIAQRVTIGWKYKIELSDMFSDHHHHLLCLSCGSLTSTDEHDQIEDTIALVATKHGFTPTAHQLEIQGYCHDCSAKQITDTGTTNRSH